MPDYQRLYYSLFNAVTDVIEALRQDSDANETAVNLLCRIQAEAEERFLQSDEKNSHH